VQIRQIIRRKGLLGENHHGLFADVEGMLRKRQLRAEGLRKNWVGK
jgi:hypothetical protein